MRLIYRDGTLHCGKHHYPSTVGKGGLVSVKDKSEGDNATPIGEWSLREVFYRLDRVSQIETALPSKALTEEDGWCDAPDHPEYNQHVMLPFDASHERLWRKDGAYDIIVVLGYNDAPAIAGKGSAIFLHCLHDDGRPTAGCLAMEKEALIEVLGSVDCNSSVLINA